MSFLNKTGRDMFEVEFDEGWYVFRLPHGTSTVNRVFAIRQEADKYCNEMIAKTGNKLAETKVKKTKTTTWRGLKGKDVYTEMVYRIGFYHEACRNASDNVFLSAISLILKYAKIGLRFAETSGEKKIMAAVIEKTEKTIATF